MPDDWFRNTTWNDSIERAFEERLRRARNKSQYLRIQACTLAASHPEVALRLLDRYFALPDDFDHARAHVDRAIALTALGRHEDAICSYEAALAHEAELPHRRTGAWLDLAFLVATRGIRQHYDRAVSLLEKHSDPLMFPIERFLWHSALSLIAADTNQAAVAKEHAECALKAAAAEHSGFRHHPTLGLVTSGHDALIAQLEACRRARNPRPSA